MMHQYRLKPITRTLQPPPFRTIQATDNEIILILAALQHYPLCGCHQGKLAEVIPIIQGFIQRVHDQLPPRREQIEGQELARERNKEFSMSTKCQSLYKGNVNQKVDPSPNWLFMPTFPLCCSMSRRQRCRPRPRLTLLTSRSCTSWPWK